MLRGTTTALLLGIAEVNAYNIRIPWAENVPRGWASRTLGITEESDVYFRVFAPGSRGYGDQAGPGDQCSLRVSPTIWSSSRVICGSHPTPSQCLAARPDLGVNSDTHFSGYTCTVTGGRRIDEMAAANDGSAISVEVWHNKLTPVTDRRTDQLLGTCKLAFELIHQNPLRDSSVEDDCYVLDALQCDSTLRSSTTFGLKICVDQESPPPPAAA